MAMAAPLAGAAVEGAAAGGAAAGAGSTAAGSAGGAARAAGTGRGAGAGRARGSASRARPSTRSSTTAGATGPAGGDVVEVVDDAAQQAEALQPDQQAQPNQQGTDQQARSRPRSSKSGQQVAGGLLAALVAYPVLLNFLQGGSPQVKRWARAKFLNRTSTSSTSAAASTGSTSVVNVALAGKGYTPRSVLTAGVVQANGPPATSTPSTGSGAAAAIAFARAQIGEPYGWGDEGPNSWDCSGLTQAAMASAGVRIPRVTTFQMTAGTRVARADIRAGDLVFPRIGHVGIATSATTFIEAPRTGLKVREVPIWGYVTARRVL